MNSLDKLKLLADAGKYDSCGSCKDSVEVNKGLGGLYNVKRGNESCTLFKTLMDNSCKMDCKYCINCKNIKSTKKARYTPAELSKTFNTLLKKGYCDGLFLSSGVGPDPDKTTESMIDAVRLVRTKYRFRGYIHFKVLPGTSKHLIRQAAFYATRMSINIEAPSGSRMSELSSTKDFKIDILRRQAWLKTLTKDQTTQLIVGGTDTTDKEILKMADWEYDKFDLKRIFYSAFQPVKGTPLQNKKPENPLREHRLYNIDFMIRQYGIKTKEFFEIMDDGMLPREDPKLVLARNALDRIDINQADWRTLVRVPGIGPKSANKIINLRKKQKITRYRQLYEIGILVKRAKPFIDVAGKRQMSLKAFV